MAPGFCLDKIIDSCKKTKNITIKYISCTNVFEEDGEGEEIIKKESFNLENYAVFVDDTGILLSNKKDDTDAVLITMSSVLEISPRPEREEKKMLMKKESVFEKLE